MTEHNGIVRITLHHVYDKLLDVERKVDGYSATVLTVQDHEQRIRKAERVMWMALGVATASPFIVGLVVG